MDIYLFFLILTALAVYRATRLVVDDEFPPVRAARDWVTGLHARRLRPEPSRSGYATRLRGAGLTEALADLVTCRYCASGWVALVATVAVDRGGQLELGWLLGALWWFGAWGLAVGFYNWFEVDVVTADPTTEVPSTQELVADDVDDPTPLTARELTLRAVARVGYADVLRYVVQDVPAAQRAEVLAATLRTVNGDASATVVLGSSRSAATD